MAKINSGGTTANYTGNILENFIESRLVEQGYELIVKNNFNPAICLKQPIYKFCLGKSIYGTSFYCDFLYYFIRKSGLIAWL
jgi:hypothetical protein